MTGAGRFLPGTVLAGRYRIFGHLGKGGMGEVYRADDLSLLLRIGRLPEDRAVQIARQLCAGIHASTFVEILPNGRIVMSPPGPSFVLPGVRALGKDR